MALDLSREELKVVKERREIRKVIDPVSCGWKSTLMGTKSLLDTATKHTLVCGQSTTGCASGSHGFVGQELERPLGARAATNRG